MTEARPLYTPEERRRRDETPWTFVQGILAPIQFLVFMVSTVLVVRYLITGDGETLATVSVVLKTMLLYLISRGEDFARRFAETKNDARLAGKPYADNLAVIAAIEV